MGPQLGGIPSSAPGPGLHPPGGPSSSEPGWWPQQVLGPGPPATNHQGEVYSGHAGMGPQLGGIPSSAPGPGLHPPGGPSSSEPGWWPQQVLGPGPPATNHQGEVYSGHAGMGPQLGGIPSSAPGPGLHPPGGPSSSEPGWWPQQALGPEPPATNHQGEVYSGHAGMGPQLGGIPSSAPGPGLHPPGGPSSGEPGWWPQQALGPGPRAPETNHHGGVYSGHAGMGPQLGGIPSSAPGPGLGPPTGKSRRRNHTPVGTSHSLSLQRVRSLKVEPFPPHCSMKNIQEALQDMFGKFGTITSIQVNGRDAQRSAMVVYKFVKDRDRALSGTQGTSLFNKKIDVTVWPYERNQSHTAKEVNGFFAEKGSGTLYISNLRKSVSQNDLLRSFFSFGKIFYTEVQKLPGLYNYGVVQFANKVSASKAIRELNGRFLSRRMLKEKFGDSFSSSCIFVYGLSKTNFTPASLGHHFCQFGTLNEVLFNSESTRALVFFEDLSSAEKAIHEIRKKSGSNFLKGDYANHEFLARFRSSIEMRWQTRQVLRFETQSKSGTKVLAKENETQILVDNSEEQQKDFFTGTGEEEEADMLAEASEEEEEADMLAEVSEKMEGLDEVGEEQEEVSQLLDWSEKLEASSDSGEEAAEPVPEADEISMPAFAEVVKKNPPSERNSTFSIPAIVHGKKSK
ncbi:uncharacterized protein LOC144799432 [Lissotriton helveticus]